MGLCMCLKKDFDTDLNIGYFWFFHLRVEILNSIEYGLGEEFKKSATEQRPVSEECYYSIAKKKLKEFMFHSDCEGILKLKTIKRTYIALKDLELTDKEFEKTFKEMMKLFEKAIRIRSDIEYC